jgi:hypothetical protein
MNNVFVGREPRLRAETKTFSVPALNMSSKNLILTEYTDVKHVDPDSRQTGINAMAAVMRNGRNEEWMRVVASC